MTKKIFQSLISACVILAATSFTHAAEGLSPIPKIANEWSFELTPYVWLSQISSTLSYKDQYINTTNVIPGSEW
jgi:hypothetical protein